jgi:phage baseplate assembly protein W
MAVVYSDINVRLFSDEDKFLTTDAKAVFQSIYRLLTTMEGEIPYHRSYGCNLKRFLQYPLNEDTANAIFEYCQAKVNQYETRGSLISANAIADYDNNTLKMQLVVQVAATGETGVLPDLNVRVKG